MATLLYIESSPRKQRAHSIEVARAFLETYRSAHPSDTVTTLNLWSHPLMEFDGDTIQAKYNVMHGQKHTAAQAAAWERVKAEFKRLADADKLLLSLPMWNFGVPYKLKHFIDVVTQPGLAFNVTPEGGYQGLVTGKPTAVIYARGGQYPAGTPGAAYDFQKPYIELWLGFIGLTKIQSIVVEPSLGAPEQFQQAKAAALELARRIARDF